MDEELDIEEHDIWDNPRIRTIFPDITQIKAEIQDCDSCDLDKDTRYQPRLETHQKDRQNGDKTSECMRCSSKVLDKRVSNDMSDKIAKYEETDEGVNENEDLFKENLNQTKSLIPGSKPSSSGVINPLTVKEVKNGNNDRKDPTKAYVLIENCGVKLENNVCYCRKCKILFPTWASLQTHSNSTHSLQNVKRYTRRNRNNDNLKFDVTKVKLKYQRKGKVPNKGEENRLVETKLNVTNSLAPHFEDNNSKTQDVPPILIQTQSFSKALFKCRKCYVYFLTVGGLQDHFEANHQIFDVRSCPFCTLKFLPPTLEKHIELHHRLIESNVSDFDIVTCDDDTVINETIVRPVEPDDPGMQPAVKSNLNAKGSRDPIYGAAHPHNKVKLKQYSNNLYKCKSCHLLFLTVRSIRTHKKNSCGRDQNTVVCSQCGYLFSNIVICRHRYIHHTIMHLKREDFKLTYWKPKRAVKSAGKGFKLNIGMQIDTDTQDKQCSTADTKNFAGSEKSISSVQSSISLPIIENIGEEDTIDGRERQKNTLNYSNDVYNCSADVTQNLAKGEKNMSYFEDSTFLIKSENLAEEKSIDGLDRQISTAENTRNFVGGEKNISSFEDSISLIKTENLDEEETINANKNKDIKNNYDIAIVSPDCETKTQLVPPILIPTQSLSKALFKCRKCYVYFLTVGGLRDHFKANHHTFEVRSCPFCTLKFMPPTLEKHIELHHRLIQSNFSDFNIVTCDDDTVINETIVRPVEPDDPGIQPAVQSNLNAKGSRDPIYGAANHYAKLNLKHYSNNLYKCKKCRLHCLTQSSLRSHLVYKKNNCLKNSDKVICSQCGYLFNKIVICKHQFIHHTKMNLKREDFNINYLESEPKKNIKSACKEFKLNIGMQIDIDTKDSQCSTADTKDFGIVKNISSVQGRISLPIIENIAKEETLNGRKGHINSINYSITVSNWTADDTQNLAEVEINMSSFEDSISLIKSENIAEEETINAQHSQISTFNIIGDTQNFVGKQENNISVEDYSTTAPETDLKQCLPKTLAEAIILEQASANEVKDDAVVKLVKCPCGLHFESKEALDKHFAICGNNTVKVRCSQCQCVFNTTELAEHLRKHHNKNEDIKNDNDIAIVSPECETKNQLVPQTQSLSKALFKCRKCYVYFLTVGGLRDHFKANHHTFEVRSCPVCTLKFLPPTLEKHIELHHRLIQSNFSDFNIVTCDDDTVINETIVRPVELDDPAIQPAVQSNLNAKGSCDPIYGAATPYAKLNLKHYSNINYLESEQKKSVYELNIGMQTDLNTQYSQCSTDDTENFAGSKKNVENSIPLIKIENIAEEETFDGRKRQINSLNYSNAVYNCTADDTQNLAECEKNMSSFENSVTLIKSENIAEEEIINAQHSQISTFNITDNTQSFAVKQEDIISVENFCTTAPGTDSKKSSPKKQTDTIILEEAVVNISDDESVVELFDCPCGLHFESDKALDEHVAVCGDNIAKKRCSQCQCIFNSTELAEHLSKDHNENKDIKSNNDFPVVSPDYKKKTQDDTPLLIEKTKNVTDTEYLSKLLFKCSKCRVYFLTVNDLRYHFERKHDAVYVSYCPFCKLKFMPTTLKRHIKLHHRMIECNVNDFNIQAVTPVSSNFKAHFSYKMHPSLYSNNLYQCKICHMNSITSSSLVTHITKALNGHSFMRYYKMVLCPQCGYLFSKLIFARHYYMHHKIMNLNRRDFKINSMTHQKGEICANTANEHEELDTQDTDNIKNFAGGEEHIKSVEDRTLNTKIEKRKKETKHSKGRRINTFKYSSVLYRCAQCGVVSVNPDMREHILRHLNMVPSANFVKCECGLSFERSHKQHKRSYDKHVQLHHVEQNLARDDLYIITITLQDDLLGSNHLFQCEVCNINFISLDMLEIHMLDSEHTYTSGRECLQCGFVFRVKLLSFHEKLHHDTMKLNREDFVVLQTSDDKTLRRVESPNTVKLVKEIATYIKDNYTDGKYKATLYKCFSCSTHFCTFVSMSLHLKSCEAECENEDSVICDECNLKFSNHALVTHKKVHHKEMGLKQEEFQILPKM